MENNIQEIEKEIQRHFDRVKEINRLEIVIDKLEERKRKLEDRLYKLKEEVLN